MSDHNNPWGKALANLNTAKMRRSLEVTVLCSLVQAPAHAEHSEMFQITREKLSGVFPGEQSMRPDVKMVTGKICDTKRSTRRPGSGSLWA